LPCENAPLQGGTSRALRIGGPACIELLRVELLRKSALPRSRLFPNNVLLLESLRAMKTIESHWHDAENNRRVAYSVAYAHDGQAIEIKAVTPTQVTFICPESKNELRSVGVWTQKGRDMLAHQLRTSGHLTELQREIEVTLAV
jgi:hypothetical protein